MENVNPELEKLECVLYKVILGKIVEKSLSQK